MPFWTNVVESDVISILQRADRRVYVHMWGSAENGRLLRACVDQNGADIGMNMSPDATALEPHYRISDLAERWIIGKEPVRKLCMNEPGVIKIRLGKLIRHTTYSVPETVALRIY